MNYSYLIDTDIIIDFMNGRFNLNQKFTEVRLENCYVSEITIAELYFGAYRSSKQQERLKEVDDLVDSFNIIPISEFLKKFGEQKALLVSKGRNIGDFDTLIGITAMKMNMILVTGNEKHHSRIENIVIENWRKSNFNKHL